ncbi:uncharacterized protein LOC132041636 [Lycium ferocissimum]|uniref:uncharacterized protein LOC132041636 n=1 Tax=Lycium ferocissimum TaxID=112874 RepID=UPI002814A76D|nr:uncharacterized protein LOC132041636 [Lycium ferocissimum]
MDLEDWEILPDDGFLQIHDDDGKMIFSRKYTSDSKNEFNMNYFICPSPKSSQFVDTTGHPPRVPNQIVPFQIQETSDDQEVITKLVITNFPLEINMLPSHNIEDPTFIANMMEVEQDQVSSQVFFKKMKENDFENMKMDSPKSNNKPLLSQFEEKVEDLEVEKEMVIKKIGIEKEDTEENNGGLNLLNKSLNGIGAICSFGVAAAATICIIFIGNHQKQKQNQKLRFQIFSHDKRMKQVVHHATRLNEAISAVRGVPVTRAHITVGGYYDAL